MVTEKNIIYKICARDIWEQAVYAKYFTGVSVDHASGFIHFSTASQVQETARRHFFGEDNLVLIALSDVDLGYGLRYEVSRGGDYFPHLYGTFDPACVLWVKHLPLQANGEHLFPKLD